MEIKELGRISELATHFSKRSNYWDEIYSKRKDPPNFMIFELDNRMRAVLNYVDKFANGRKLKILDIGCGTGHYLEQLLIRGHNVFGIDVAMEMLKKSSTKVARFEAGHKLSLANIEKLPFQDKSFDVILCIGVIEYLPDIYKPLQEINRIIVKEGMVIISAPNLFRLHFFIDPYYFSRGWNYLLHRLGFTKSKIDKSIKDVSMNIDFKNKRFRLKKLIKLFETYNLILNSFTAVAFGPVSFFLKPVFKLKTNINLSIRLTELSKKSRYSILKKISNRWVFDLRKSK